MNQSIKRVGDAQGLLDLIPSMPHTKQVQFCFSSPEDMVKHLDATPCGKFWQTTTIRDSDPDFYGVSYDEAKRMVREGWSEGAERVARLRDKIAVTIPTKLRVDEHHVAGALVNVPRYLAGDPKCMKRPVPRFNRARPILTLVNHMGGLSMVPKACFINRCAVIAAIVDAIEASGYSCHVLGVTESAAMYGSAFLAGTIVTVKEPGDVPDVARMAFALGHVGMFRRLVFAAYSTDREASPLGDCMGKTADFPKLDVPNVFVMPSMNGVYQHFKTEQDSERLGLPVMIEALQGQGCPAFPREEAA